MPIARLCRRNRATDHGSLYYAERPKAEIGYADTLICAKPAVTDDFAEQLGSA